MHGLRVRHLLPGLLIGAMLLGLFVLLAWGIKHPPNLLTDLDARLMEDLHEYQVALPVVTVVVERLTDLGAPRTMTLVAVGLALILLGQRRFWMALACPIIVSGGDWLNRALKQWIGRPRPPFVSENTSFSFPSGHAMLAIIGYGLLGYLLVGWLSGRRERAAVIVGLTLLVLVIGFSRLYLTVHYFSDVLAGFTMGACWLLIGLAGAKLVSRRSPGSVRGGASLSPGASSEQQPNSQNALSAQTELK
jgi:undecaprenyl-diphosphatase